MKSDRKEGCWGRYHVACSWSYKRTNGFVNWRRKSSKSHGHRHFRWTSLCLAPSLFGNPRDRFESWTREKNKTSGFILWRDNERIVASAFGSAFSGCRKLSNFFPLFFLYFLLKRKIHFYFIFCGNRFNQLKWILFYRLKFYSFSHKDLIDNNHVILLRLMGHLCPLIRPVGSIPWMDSVLIFRKLISLVYWTCNHHMTFFHVLASLIRYRKSLR